MKLAPRVNIRPMTGGKQTVAWQWIVAVLVSMAVFLDTVDVSIINMALPTLKLDLQLATAEVPWVQGAYLLTNAGLQLLGGRSADLFGRRRIFLLGILLFGLSSLTCGLAHNGWQLLLARGAQGIGAAMMFPSAISILTTTFAEGPERSKALGIFSATAGAGFSCGLVVGGVVTTFISWHWIFFVNVPLVALIVLLTRLAVPEDRPAAQARSYDLAGALTATAGLLLLVYTITQAPEPSATLARTIGLFLLAGTLLVMFVLIERRASVPLLPLRLFRSSTLCAANASMFILLGTLFGFLFLFTFALQDVLHYSPLDASLALLPGSILSLLASRFLAPVLVNRLGMKWSSVIGQLSMMAGFVLFLRIGIGSNYIGGVLPSALFVLGGMGIVNPSLALAGVSGIEKTEQGLAAGLQGAVGAAGGGVGVAIITVVVATTMAIPLDVPRTGSMIVALTSGLHAGLLVEAAGAVLGALMTLVGIRK